MNCLNFAFMSSFIEVRTTIGPFGISGDFQSSTRSFMSRMPLSTIFFRLPEV
ncbi:hypothetical protein D9M70_581850 [compost metagenome]